MSSPARVRVRPVDPACPQPAAPKLKQRGDRDDRLLPQPKVKKRRHCHHYHGQHGFMMRQDPDDLGPYLR